MLKKCKYCGTLNLDNAVNCSNCGQALADSPIQKNLGTAITDSEKNHDETPAVQKTGVQNKNDTEIDFKEDSVKEELQTAKKIKNEINDSVEQRNKEGEIGFKPNFSKKTAKPNFSLNPLDWKKSVVAGVVLGLLIVIALPACNSNKDKDNSTNEATSSVVETTPTPEATAAPEQKVFKAPKELSEISGEFKEVLKAELSDQVNAWIVDENKTSSLNISATDKQLSEPVAVGEYLMVSKEKDNQSENCYGILYKLKYTSEITDTFIYTTFSIKDLSVCGDEFEEIDVNNVAHRNYHNKAPNLESFHLSAILESLNECDYCFDSVDEFKQDTLDANISSFKYEYNDLDGGEQ